MQEHRLGAGTVIDNVSAIDINHDCREALKADALADFSLSITIDTTSRNTLFLQSSGDTLIFRLECLAMATPWGIEQNNSKLVLSDKLGVCCSVQFNNISLFRFFLLGFFTKNSTCNKCKCKNNTNKLHVDKTQQ